jgi:hypothetical protein
VIGESCFVFQQKDGKLFACGENAFGILGLGHFNKKVLHFYEVLFRSPETKTGTKPGI